MVLQIVLHWKINKFFKAGTSELSVKDQLINISGFANMQSLLNLLNFAVVA